MFLYVSNKTQKQVNFLNISITVTSELWNIIGILHEKRWETPICWKLYNFAERNERKFSSLKTSVLPR